jgi:hypothetical protein
MFQQCDQFGADGRRYGNPCQDCAEEPLEVRKDDNREHAAKSQDRERLRCVSKPGGLRRESQQYKRRNNDERDRIRHAFHKSRGEYECPAQTGTGTDHQGACDLTRAGRKEIVAEIADGCRPKCIAHTHGMSGAEKNSPSGGTQEK